VTGERLAELAHRLRTPLSVIAGYAELLEARDDDAFRREAALQIRHAADVLTGLVDDVVVALALDEGEVIFDPEPLDVRESLKTALADAKADGRASLADGPAVPAVLADREQLQRILRGILAHALGRSLSREISITTEVQDHTVVTRVRADGPSLPSNHLGTLFDRFAEMGLSNARRLAELHGGNVWAEDSGRVLALALPAA
jgi:signal transduction histidine kinase